MWKLWPSRKKDYESKIHDLSENIKSCRRKRRNLERFSVSATHFMLKSLFLVYGILSSVIFYYTHNWWIVITVFVSSIISFWFLRKLLRWFVANRAKLYVSEIHRLREEMRELLNEAKDECNFNTMSRLLEQYSLFLENNSIEDDNEFLTDHNTNNTNNTNTGSSSVASSSTNPFESHSSSSSPPLPHPQQRRPPPAPPKEEHDLDDFL
eukprot:gb/GECH01000073.1/.p1 GENE.gb/GECH01000073.1/~~gb/GECH01000073.1/.p1  ORF type:complete len:209 (+),score=55.61 gb/GECH01000073.1/:1-627(+)